jgi:DNA-binding NarL/FixJ family response regulator
MSENPNKAEIKIKVIITEDQKSYRQGLCSYFEDENIDVIAEAENGKELLQLLTVVKLRPDVILLDIEMPVMDGGEALIEIKKFNPSLKVMMLTFVDNKDVMAEMKKNGANAYMDKNSDLKDVVRVIRELHHSDNYTNIPDSLKPNLTTTETEIMLLMADGKTSSEIAKIRKRSIKSVEAHRKNLYDKLGCHNSTEFILFCKREGLIDRRRPKR